MMFRPAPRLRTHESIAAHTGVQPFLQKFGLAVGAVLVLFA
jgi:hypothetical protein